MLPDDAFSPAGVSVVDDFLIGGGEHLPIGEQEGFAAVENGYLEDLLVGVGSALSLGNQSLDAGFNDTVSAQIIDQPGLTDGISLLNYGNTNVVLGFDPEHRLFLAADLASVWETFELIDGSRLVLLGDVKLLSNLEDTVANDNHAFFLNLAPPPQRAVPALGRGAAGCYRAGTTRPPETAPRCWVRVRSRGVGSRSPSTAVTSP